MAIDLYSCVENDDAEGKILALLRNVWEIQNVFDYRHHQLMAIDFYSWVENDDAEGKILALLRSVWAIPSSDVPTDRDIIPQKELTTVKTNCSFKALSSVLCFSCCGADLHRLYRASCGVGREDKRTNNRTIHPTLKKMKLQVIRVQWK